MKFSYNWLKELVPFKESPEKLAEFLTLRAFEVESVEKIGNDFALDLKIFSNRIADAGGHTGLAREIAALKKLRLKTLKSAAKVKEDKKEKTGDNLSVRVENQDACLRYSARIMGQISVKPSPLWLRERIETCGIQSINNIVDAANYIMLETGQPLHVFDFEKLRSRSKTKKTIIVRPAKPNETIETLDEKTYTLPQDTLVIADEESAIAIAGIKGGNYAGVSEHTRGIILESANFNSTAIRTSSQTLKLRTDASIRFENGLDQNQTIYALDRLAELIEDLAGGIILHGAVDVYPRREKEKEILFRVDYANRLIGADIEPSFYHDSLQTLGCVVRSKRKDEFIVEPPTIRRDLTIEEDLIEEVSRLIGLDAIPAELPEIATLSPKEAEELYWEKKIAEFAKSAGFYEALVYEFTGERELEHFLMDASESLELQNPTSPETRYLVPRALVKYAEAAAENLRHTDLAGLFGVAKSFTANASAAERHKEKKDLIFAYGKKSSERSENFYALKGVVDGLFEMLGIADHWYDDVLSLEEKKHNPMFHPYRMAQIKAGNTLIGVIGELHPEVLRRLKTKTRITAAEFDVNLLLSLARSEHEFQPPSRFPAIIRDIAVTVPANTKTETLLNVIEQAGGPLLDNTELFDYFQDEAMKEGDKKSLAFHLIFQSPERTLKDEEVVKLMQKIRKTVEEHDWEVRS